MRSKDIADCVIFDFNQEYKNSYQCTRLHSNGRSPVLLISQKGTQFWFTYRIYVLRVMKTELASRQLKFSWTQNEIYPNSAFHI